MLAIHEPSFFPLLQYFQSAKYNCRARNRLSRTLKRVSNEDHTCLKECEVNAGQIPTRRVALELYSFQSWGQENQNCVYSKI